MSLEPNQAIPNRRDVAEDKGIKIYFDAVETAGRVEINKGLVTRVFHEATAPLGVLSTYTPDAVEQLVWHVAAHEVGHAIYNLGAVSDEFSQPSCAPSPNKDRPHLTINSLQPARGIVCTSGARMVQSARMVQTIESPPRMHTLSRAR